MVAGTPNEVNRIYLEGVVYDALGYVKIFESFIFFHFYPFFCISLVFK